MAGTAGLVTGTVGMVAGTSGSVAGTLSSAGSAPDSLTPPPTGKADAEAPPAVEGIAIETGTGVDSALGCWFATCSLLGDWFC